MLHRGSTRRCPWLATEVVELKIRTSTILCIVLSCLVQLGCDQSPVPETLSDAFIKFDPDGEFAARGFLVEPTKRPGTVSPRDVYGWRPFQGSIVLPPDSSGCESVAEAVHDALDRVVAVRYRSQIVQSPDRRSGQPLFATYRYSDGGMRGFVHVWLFPDETETQISYAILLHEEKPAIAHQAISLTADRITRQ